MSKTKYKNGDIVCLFNGKTVYVLEVDDKAKEYKVCDTEDKGTLFTIKESEIFMKVV